MEKRKAGQAKKSLGQHFLRSDAALEKITDAVSIEPGEVVLEIGPGHGELTERLLRRGARVVAVEKDEALADELCRSFAKEAEEGSLTVIAQDALAVPFADLEGALKTADYKLVGNIPYYITGALLRRFLTTEHQPSRIVFLIQKEVAERIARDPKESLLSLSVKAYGDPHYHGTVKAGSFSPPPKVDSAILVIASISRERFINSEADEEVFFRLLRLTFSQRRKQLKGMLPFISEENFRACKITPTDRPEDVSLEKWLCLARPTLGDFF